MSEISRGQKVIDKQAYKESGVDVSAPILELVPPSSKTLHRTPTRPSGPRIPRFRVPFPDDCPSRSVLHSGCGSPSDVTNDCPVPGHKRVKAREASPASHWAALQRDGPVRTSLPGLRGQVSTIKPLARGAASAATAIEPMGDGRATRANGVTRALKCSFCLI